MKKNRVSAFTIIEITITMLISAILIGITYTSYSIIARSYSSFNTKNENLAVVLRLNKLLQKDFDRCEMVLKDSTGLSITFPDHKVKYKFEPDYTVRIGSMADTFKVRSDSVSMQFENSITSDLGANDEQNRLDELRLVFTLQKEKIPYHYYKVYSSVNLFNRNANAGN